MRPPDPTRRDDAELLERHVLARAGDPPDRSLEEFRRSNPRLVREADRVLARLRARLNERSEALESGLANAKHDGHARAHVVRPTVGHLPSSVASLTRRWIVRSVSALAVMSFAIVAWYGLRWTSRRGVHAETRTYATTTGQRAVVQLADGSRVVLAPRTTMTVDASGRSVSLRGEAYFDVAPNARAGFVVRTGDVTTRVLGTAFDVTAYAGDSTVRVVVERGKVQTRTGSHAWAILTGGMIGIVTDSNVTVNTTNDVIGYTGWANGRLEFHATPLPTVLTTLERWYGVRFLVADSVLRGATLSGRFDFGSTEDVLQALSASLGAHLTFEHSGDTTIVVLHAQRAASREIPRHGAETPLTSLREIGR